jgi:hypothetical protein
MAITANTFNTVGLPSDGPCFYKSLQSADLTGAEEIIAGAAGKSHYITYLQIRTATAMGITIGSGETTGAVTTTYIGLVPLDAASGIFVWKAPPGMGLRCTSGLALVIDSDTAGAVWIEARGKTCKDNMRA